MPLRLVWALGGIILLSSIGSCSASRLDDRAYFVFELKVGATAESLKNIHYTFGTEITDRVRPVARPGLSFEDFSAQMQIPERLDVSWETHDGKKHAVTVPVRGHLGGPIRGKTLLFVLQEDSVEGYITIGTPTGRMVEKRFF